jgi:hypothetical protein
LDDSISVDIGKMWLQTAKLCRKAGYQQSSLGSILHASELATPNIHLEKAKYFWNKGQHHKAIFELQSFLCQGSDASDSGNMMDEVVRANDIRIDTQSDKYIRAKVMILSEGLLSEH